CGLTLVYPNSGQLPPANPASIVIESPCLLEMSQFRQFAEIFAGMEEPELLEAFISWIQTACQTSRVVLLMRDTTTGAFHSRAQRGLPSALLPHCVFPQTAPLCRWLSTSGRILLRDLDTSNNGGEIMAGMDLMQAIAAVPIIFDGQLVGIIGLGPRLIGHQYSAYELEGIFAIANQVAVAVFHRRLHCKIKQQQELTEHMLGVMPTGTIVLGSDHRIAFINTAAADILGKSHSSLIGADLRSLPSPLGDLAYESLMRNIDLSQRELTLATTGKPVAVTSIMLETSAPNALLLLEDRSTQRGLETERDLRVNLELVTNLVHYIAHELRNPLVTLSTFASMIPRQKGENDFYDFSVDVLEPEIERINLLIEQLLILTHHADYQPSEFDLGAMLERIAGTEEIQNVIVTSIPESIPPITGDMNRFETALTCLLRSVAKLSIPEKPATMCVEIEDGIIVISIEAPSTDKTAAQWLLNPWQQLITESEQQLDFGVATAQYIFEQHHGSLTVNSYGNVLAIVCRLPLQNNNDSNEGVWNGTKKSTDR
ncbi:MAG: histidine kinase dimerization/phospho-acceptor domain-containing protein, partial [bacterium]